MSLDAHDGAQNLATVGPQALVHDLHGVLREKEDWVIGLCPSPSSPTFKYQQCQLLLCPLTDPTKALGKGVSRS